MKQQQSVIASIFAWLLIKGSPLDPNGTREEQEQRIPDQVRKDELIRIGREEARAERAAKKKGGQ